MTQHPASTTHSTHKGSLAQSVELHLKDFFATNGTTIPISGLYQTVIEEVERTIISYTMSFCDNNQSKAANILGINRNTLRKKIEQFNLVTKDK